MYGAVGVANPYLLPQVILAPVLDEIQANDSNLEPPMVRIRASNSSFLSVDSTEDAEGSSSKFVIGGGGQPPLEMRRIKRIAFYRYVGTGNSPNINKGNNQIVFRSSNTGFAVDYTAIIPEGYYNTVAQALTALVTALNTATPAGFGLVFATTPYDAAAGAASDPQRARLTSAGGTFAFSPDSLMSKFGTYLYGLPFVTALNPVPASYAAQASNNLPIGQILLLSTRWIDIISQATNEYTKNPSTGNDLGGNNLVARLYITLPTLNTSTTTLNAIPNEIVQKLTWTNYDRTRQLGTLDITLLDEFARVLYQAPLGVPGDPPIAIAWSNSFTQLQFLAEI